MPTAGRIGMLGLVALAVSGAILISSLGLLFRPTPSLGWAVITIFVSASTWWLASVFTELVPSANASRISNHLNSYAAALAAYAGFLAVGNGWAEVIKLFGH